MQDFSESCILYKKKTNNKQEKEMRKLSIVIAMVLIAITSTTVFTSCLGDDDDEYKTYTQAEMAAFMRQIDGNYKGSLILYNDTVSSANGRIVDSLSVSSIVSAADSTIVINDVPARVFAKYFYSSTYDPFTAMTTVFVNPLYESLVNALKALPNQQLVLHHVFYDTTNTGLIYYGIYPEEKTFRLNYDGADHTVSFRFLNNLNCNGQYYDGKVSYVFYVYDIRIDETTYWTYAFNANDVDANSIFVFSGKR